MDEAHQCVRVVIGATVDGKKELLAIQDGDRESEPSWKELLLDLKHRGLAVDPKLAIGEGALGFWKALPRSLEPPVDNGVGSTRRPTG
jgi:transposase-like protein